MTASLKTSLYYQKCHPELYFLNEVANNDLFKNKCIEEQTAKATSTKKLKKEWTI